MKYLFSFILAALLLSVTCNYQVSVQAWEDCSVTATDITGECVPLEMWDSETANAVNFNLHTAVVTDLTITFSEASGRITTTPSVVNLATGATGFTVSTSVNYLVSDGRVRFRPTYTATFSGTDAGSFPSSFNFNITLRPRIPCRVLTPQYVFYPGDTNYGVFNVTCDEAQDSPVTFVPPDLTANGITWSPVSGVTFAPWETSGTFNASAIAGTLPVGSYPLNFTNVGDNATRYRQVDVYTMRVRPQGRITPPPTFAYVSYRDTEEFKIDLTIRPRFPIYVRIHAFFVADHTNASSVIQIKPSPVIAYNSTNVRGRFRVYATKFDEYYLNFTISGDEAPLFRDPLIDNPVRFTINSPREGFAFDRRATVGYLPRLKGCRVGVGRRSFYIDGQEPVDENICVEFPKYKNLSSADYNCSRWVTPERCQGVVEEQGWPCAWLTSNSTCVAVPQILNNISQVAFGSSSTGFLDLNGTVYTIGRNLYGQLGRERAPENTLLKVDLPEAIKVIAAGANHYLALAGSGTLYAWGSNFRGQLGISNEEEPSVPTPTIVTFPRTENVTCIASGPEHSACVTTAGRAYTWGFNNRGQLGLDQTYNETGNPNPVNESASPVLIPQSQLGGGVSGTAIGVNCGEQHTVIATDSQTYTFGGNTHGQLGRLGVDDHVPGEPVLWNNAQPVGSAPTYPSYVLGKDCP